jgi:hypothetical protein
MRDNFDKETKDVLARRVGHRCSRPNCRKPTTGPQSDASKALNIGVAAHITAASKGGPRYDESLSPEERKSIDNAIHLCQNCGKLVDNDEKRYTADLLREWKKLSEQVALLDVEAVPQSKGSTKNNDIKLIRFFSQCLDRSAFQYPFRQEGSMEAFDRAIEDTITAINTGCLRARDGQVLAKAKGKSYLLNLGWRKRMDAIVDLLRALRSRYSLGVQTGQIELGHEHQGRRFYCIYNPELADWMDTTRGEIIHVFSDICKDAGIASLKSPIDCSYRRKY